jgi:hypothetical protein
MGCRVVWWQRLLCSLYLPRHAYSPVEWRPRILRRSRLGSRSSSPTKTGRTSDPGAITLMRRNLARWRSARPTAVGPTLKREGSRPGTPITLRDNESTAPRRRRNLIVGIAHGAGGVEWRVFVVGRLGGDDLLRPPASLRRLQQWLTVRTPESGRSRHDCVYPAGRTTLSGGRQVWSESLTLRWSSTD